ncbi:hypothetical protein PG995_004044 [Apiospora arundinis]
MAPGRKQGTGCWTCRLRRKRCDSVRPVCGSCKNLDIACHASAERPPWMDGGDGQRRMSDTIKQNIKHNAIRRKERRILTHEHQAIVITTRRDFEAALKGATKDATTHSLASTAATAPGVGGSAGSDASSPSTHIKCSPAPSSIGPSEKSELPPLPAPTDSRPVPNTRGCSSGLCRSIFAPTYLESVMASLDFVWPFLFPFYRPSLTDMGIMGRQWLLSLLHQDKFTVHMGQSMCEYLLSLIAHNDGQELDCDCKALVLDRLVDKTDLALKAMQEEVSGVWHQGTETSLSERARIMGSIAQLLVVEVTIRRDVDWAIHLTPALMLFEEVFKNHGPHSKTRPSLAFILHQLAPSSAPGIAPLPFRKIVLNTEEQSAFVFYVSLLLFYDIVASTALGKPPALQSYHCALLLSPSEEQFPIRLESLVGCENWALVAIGRISTLCAWKRDAKQSGKFSLFEFVNLARPISQAIESGLDKLDASTASADDISSRRRGYYRRNDKSVDGTPLATVTRIWAHAAELYLSVTLSGWQPNSTDIKDGVAKVLSLLQTIDSPAQLQSLTWPMFIAGCLALPNQEAGFRAIIQDMGELAKFGTILSAFRIMEAVWRSRDAVDRDVWDIASSLSVLGSPPLLV